MNSGVSLSYENSNFQRRHNYVIITYCRANIDGTFFYNFSVPRNIRMIHAKNCEELPKFIKVVAKILSVPFSLTPCTSSRDTFVTCSFITAPNRTSVARRVSPRH